MVFALGSIGSRESLRLLYRAQRPKNRQAPRAPRKRERILRKSRSRRKVDYQKTTQHNAVGDEVGLPITQWLQKI
jgi:hypothetical protein